MRELLSRIWKKDEGFSLIELIIVIAILAIIAAIAVPNLLSNIQRANESTDVSNAKLIGDAIMTAIAQTPTLEGATIGDTDSDGDGDDAPRSFNAAGATAEGGNGATVITNALATFSSGTVPTIKASTNGQTGSAFFVRLDNDGAVEIYGATSAGAVDTTNRLYPE